MPDEGVQPTPEEFLRHFDALTQEERIVIAQRLGDASYRAGECFIRDHEGRIDDLQRITTRAIEDRDNAWRRQAELVDERDRALEALDDVGLEARNMRLERDHAHREVADRMGERDEARATIVRMGAAGQWAP